MNIVSECIGVDAIALHSVTSVIKLIATCRKLQKISSLPIIGIQLLNAIVIILIVYSGFFFVENRETPPCNICKKEE